jgi:ornithine cyclodeaminase
MSTQFTIIDAATIQRLAPPERLIEWMREAMIAVSRREVELPLRQALVLPDAMGAVGMMPGYVGGKINAAGVKLVSLVPPERRKGSSHLGLMVLYDADGLLPVAVLCGATVTAIRTSAVTAVATDVLARKDARVLAVLGAGEQGEAHVRALRYVRQFDEVRVWDIRAEAAEGLAERQNCRAAASVEEAVAGADVICTVTAAREPILPGALVTPGTHVNLIGSSFPDARETDDDLVAKSKFFVDYKPSAMAQAGELLHAIRSGLVSEDHIQDEIGAIIEGISPGRSSDNDVTVYKSLGVAAQDIVTAHKIYALARAANAGLLAQV